jgi:osmotically inducible lipoprotein OsmB
MREQCNLTRAREVFAARLLPILGVHTMNTSIRISTLLSASLLASSLILAGCSGMTRQEKGTATGAVVGGVVGNVLCGGLACTGAGAAVGGVIGHEVNK